MRFLALLALTSVLLSSAARAQLFSPGALSKAHGALEGVAQCGKCHAEGARHDDNRCLECHKEIGGREARGAGYHARVSGRACAECHREHRGANTSLIVWSPSKTAFNHALTGWPLVGAHKKNSCAKCHDRDPRRMTDDAAKELKDVLAKGRETFLGLGTECTTCHFDEHRNQEGDRCQKCHTPAEPWKSAPGFNHNKDARFPLTGRHRRVACAGCHAEDTDDAPASASAFPPPRDATFLQTKGIAFASCVNCHDDPHRGQFGKKCSQCHVTDGWRTIKQTAEDQGFHDKTAFPLRGEHTGVACKTCHGPFPGQRAQFKGLAHERCSDCHFDAHVGQIKSAGKNDGGTDCKSCHDVTGFSPTTMDAAMHASTRFPLDGSHRAVACTLCHVDDAKLARKVSASTRREVDRKGRSLLVSRTKIAFAEDVSRCDSCHRDPHRGQFAERMNTGSGGGCTLCHRVEGFVPSTFNHDDSRFPLTGKHKQAACGACHATGASGGVAGAPAGGAARRGGAVVYRPIDTACASCHADEHVGQLARNGATDCARCHATDAFRGADVQFAARHNDPAHASFPLEGKHAQVKCAACHPVATLAAGTDGDTAARYKPVPSACADCHEDEHKGAYERFKPAPVNGASPSAASHSSCAACHAPTAFLPAAFAHERTGFPLRGRHAVIACAGCHGSDTSRPVPQSCAGCHTDPHVQEFGLSCGGCHDEQTFRAPRFAVDSHRMSAFPLVGRHGALPCEECHLDKRDRTFTRTTLSCASCHARDAARATLVTVNHTRAPFNAPQCNGCHDPVAFSPAKFPGHETCFPIARSVHTGIRCAECHAAAGLRGAVATGACEGVPVRCAECHVHAEDVEARNHGGVVGYEHESEKCAGCHRAL